MRYSIDLRIHGDFEGVKDVRDAFVSDDGEFQYEVHDAVVSRVKDVYYVRLDLDIGPWEYRRCEYDPLCTIGDLVEYVLDYLPAKSVLVEGFHRVYLDTAPAPKGRILAEETLVLPTGGAS